MEFQNFKIMLKHNSHDNFDFQKFIQNYFEILNFKIVFQNYFEILTKISKFQNNFEIVPYTFLNFKISKFQNCPDTILKFQNFKISK